MRKLICARAATKHSVSKATGDLTVSRATIVRKTRYWQAVCSLITFRSVVCAPVSAAVQIRVQPDEGFNDEPSMIALADGSLYVSWISFREGFDSLQLARYRFDNGNFR